jgi:multidrug resistance efflux pump
VTAAEARLNQAKVSQNGAWLTWSRAQNLVDDPQELETRITQAQAQITEAEKNREMALVQLKRMEIQAEAANRNQSDHAALVQYEVAQKELQAAQVALEMAEVALAGAKQQVAHLVQMRDRPLSLIAQANTAWASYRQAEAAVLAAEANLAAVKAGPTPEDIAVAQVQVNEVEAALAAVKVQLAKQTLTAPRAGLISRKLANPGELAAPGATLLELSDLESVDLIVYIPATQIGRVKLGQKALVYADAYPGETFEGRVSFIAHEAEFTPRTVQTQEERVNLVFAVKITLANPDHRLKPGMPADAEILPEMYAAAKPTATPQPTPTATPETRTTPVQQPTAAKPTTLPPTTTPVAQAEILSWALNIRSGPGIDYPVVDHLAKGDTVTVIDVDPASGWLQIQFGQQTGWISNNPAYVLLK